MEEESFSVTCMIFLCQQKIMFMDGRVSEDVADTKAGWTMNFVAPHWAGVHAKLENNTSSKGGYFDLRYESGFANILKATGLRRSECFGMLLFYYFI